ncbi:MAG TPA: Uma2 family endonuclease [Polyangia bacterium]|jgi:Uma2 family endonuclease
MSVSVGHHRYSFQEYLAVEEVSTVKHEYLDGEIYAMAGGSVLHAALSAAVLAALHDQLDRRCRVFSSDLRVRVGATGLASYPDVTVVCGGVETEPENADTVVNPTLVVEVLSPSTTDYDLGEKFEHYQQIPSLAAVLYVWQDRRQIEVREKAGGAWRTSTVGPGATAVVSSLGVGVAVDALYADAGAA